MRVFTVAAIFMLIAIASAIGHSWYPPECCGGNDCSEIDEARVRVVQGGYMVDGKSYVAHKDVRPSPDGKYHACFWPYPDRLHCFFAPMLGS